MFYSEEIIYINPITQITVIFMCIDLIVKYIHIIYSQYILIFHYSKILKLSLQLKRKYKYGNTSTLYFHLQ